MKRLSEEVLQRDSDTRAVSSNDPMSDNGMIMNSIVTNEQCEQRIQSVVKELEFTDRNSLVENSTWYGLNQGYVLDVMNSSDDLVQSKCEMMLNGQQPTLLMGGSNCADSGELHKPLKALHFALKLCERQHSEGDTS